MIERIHLSNSNYMSKDVSYIPDNAADYLFKPAGLWYSFNDEWFHWCKKNNVPISGHYSYLYYLKLNFEKICVINNMESLMDFHWKYSYKVESVKAIDWKKVMKDYDGIEIQNYEDLLFHSAYKGIIWLRNWGVNGGCVWNLKEVEIFNKQSIQRI